MHTLILLFIIVMMIITAIIIIIYIIATAIFFSGTIHKAMRRAATVRTVLASDTRTDPQALPCATIGTEPRNAAAPQRHRLVARLRPAILQFDDEMT